MLRAFFRQAKRWTSVRLRFVASSYLPIILLFWLAAAFPATGEQTVRLEGRVRTDASVALRSGVKIRLETDQGQLVAEAPADSNGSFYFDNLRKTSYRLVVTTDGFETYQESLSLGYGADIAIRIITLKPLQKRPDGAGARQPRSDSLAPKNAKREYERAAGALAAKDLDAARAHLENAVKAYPCYARAQTDLAAILEAGHDLAGAEAALKKARECDPIISTRISCSARCSTAKGDSWIAHKSSRKGCAARPARGSFTTS